MVNLRLRSAHMRLMQSWLQVKAGWKDALSASVAAGLAWAISHHFLGHTRPIFAAMGAIISLSPGLANHGKQAFHLLIGVSTGVFIGELAMAYLPDVPTELRVVLVCFLAMILAVSYALVPLMAIQSGLSAIMVFAFGTEMAGIAKIEDVAIGVGLGIIFSQVLFTPDPRKTLTISAELFFHELAGIYIAAAAALEKHDAALATQNLQNCNRVHRSLIALAGSVTSAQESTVWSLRGLISSREVTSLAGYYNRAAIRLYASSLLLCESLLAVLKKENAGPAPAWLQQSLQINSENCYFLAGEIKNGTFTRQDRSKREEAPLAWLDSVNSVEMVENTLARFYKSKSRRSRLMAFRKRRIISTARAERQARKARGETGADETRGNSAKAAAPAGSDKKRGGAEHQV